MALSYLRDVQPLEGEGVTDESIAAAITANPSRYPQNQRTMLEMIQQLVIGGMAYLDAKSLVDGVMIALKSTIAESPSNESSYLRLMNGDTVDVGNPALRGEIAALGGQSIVDAFPVADPVTGPEVTRCRVAHEADLYAGAVQEAIAAAMDAEGYTAETIKAAVDAVGE